MALVTVAKKKEISEGTMLGVEAAGKKLLIAHVGGEFHAIDAVCSHMKGDLAKGELKNGIVKCPRHGAQYDVTTGKLVKDVGFAAKGINLGRGATGQSHFDVVVDGNDLRVDI
ncbi:MAG: Rieske 2Fe-2S domain-containing protein [Dehalococcoidia bacterium]|nr:Rieske 2Fe-2S domain-containing protein [Dehalococcoidia bacterium]